MGRCYGCCQENCGYTDCSCECHVGLGRLAEAIIETNLRAKAKSKPILDSDYDPRYLPVTGDRDIDDMLRACLETFQTKGDEYTVGSADRLANFRGAAEDSGLKMEQVFYVFFNKHVRAIASYVKNGKVKSNESIQSRIMDCIVYLLLFSKMVNELEGKKMDDGDSA